MSPTILASRAMFIAISIIALLGLINSPTALLLGFLFALFFKHPFSNHNELCIEYLLKVAVIGLGFGMFIEETLQTTGQGFTLTLLTILLTVALGTLLAKALKVDRKLGHLITSGTAICGGSAIAAISPVIQARGKTISMALGIVFLLNSIALFVFPSIGHLLEMSQRDFGLWCAVAIHDTSSVVGAALGYGEEALKVATTVKLSRTLWIIPLSIYSIIAFKVKGGKVTIPYFILFFILAIVANSYGVISESLSSNIVVISKRLLVLTLFLVGSALSIEQLRKTGLKPMILAMTLWVFISIFSLIYILY